MAFTNKGKEVVMSEGLDSRSRYAALHLTNNTELAGHGYARKELTPAMMAVSATGVITVARFEFYTANDASAQRAQKVSIYDAATGGNQLMTPEAIAATIPPAPENGQTLRLALTLNP